MPELPEAEITARQLKALRGKKISDFWSNWPRGIKVAKSAPEIKKDIKNRKVLDVSRKGKAIVFKLNGRTLAFHQRMSGSLRIIKSGVKADDSCVRAKVFFGDGAELWFRDPRKFGIVWYGAPEKVMNENYFASLGLDALRVSYSQFAGRIAACKGTLKPVLLRQDIFAGIGNIVADETLWDACLHPQMQIAALKNQDLRRLFRSLKKVLQRGIRYQGTSMRDWGHPAGTRGKFQDHFMVYGRKGEECARCGAAIVRFALAGRGTWICAECQK